MKLQILYILKGLIESVIYVNRKGWEFVVNKKELNAKGN